MQSEQKIAFTKFSSNRTAVCSVLRSERASARDLHRVRAQVQLKMFQIWGGGTATMQNQSSRMLRATIVLKIIASQ
jgi:hypothetical protein